VQGESTQFQQCVDVFFQQCHFVDVYEDKTLDERCQDQQRTYLTCGTHHPNRIVHAEFCCLGGVQHAFEIEETHETHQTSF
jgi:hypothetical protein